MNELPLVGVTVLDFGQVYNGPYCGFLLAQAGARVIKVESPRGETLRSRGETTGASYPFAMLNGNKECISLNIRSARGQALLRELVMHVDVVLETMRMEGIDEHGLEETDRRILRVLAESDRPLGLKTVAAAVGEAEDTIEDVYEPHLLRKGLLIRSPRGREITKAGYDLLGVESPDSQGRLFAQ